MTKKAAIKRLIREFNDRGAKWLLESPTNARGLMAIIGDDIYKNLDFSRMERLPTTLIPATLRKQEADLIFRIPYRTGDGEEEREILIFLLVEHQSKPDPLMGFRLLYYMVLIWDQQRREWQDQKIRQEEWTFWPIIPVVLYTGSESWDTPLSVSSMMDLPDALKKFVPQFDSLMLNLKESKPEDLVAPGHPFGWLLRVMQKERASRQELEKALDEALEHLAGLAEEEQEAWDKAMTYLLLLLYHRRPEKETQELSEKIRDQVVSAEENGANEMLKSWAEEALETGIQRGLQRGLR
nr:Rpn family recombination-promoting nuclease/putative transposase [Armatimonadota bacterium]